MTVMNTLLALSEKYRNPIQVVAGHSSEAGQWIAMERARLAGKSSCNDTGFSNSCGGVNSKMAVKSNGVMVPCSQLTHIEEGI